jgi:hypothetical protein
MADIQIYVLRDLTTKEIMGWSHDQFSIQSGQEEVEETIDESDFDRFNIKYRYTGGGIREINGKKFYRLNLSEDAIQHHPVNGNPRLDAGNLDYLTLSIQKEDIDGNDQISAEDNDRVYFTFSDGDGSLEYVDLINGAASGEIHASTTKGIMTITLESPDLATSIFVVETV